MENNIEVPEDKIEESRVERGLTVAEKQLLWAASSGDVEAVSGLLTNGEGNIDVNCRDLLGRSAVELAVDGGRIEVAATLLQYGANPGEALLYAVDNEDTATVRQLLKFSTTGDMPSPIAFPSEMTPIVLACHKNSLPLIKVLVDQGQFIPDPAVLGSDHISSDASLNLYRGLASPYYILLTNDDPLRRAFVLSTTLDDLAAKAPEVEEDYAEMAEECRSLSVGLLDQVRNRDEAAAILNCGDEVSPLIHGDNCQMQLSRLDMAVDHEQKKFVTHRWSHRLMKECWYGPHLNPTASLTKYLRAGTLLLLTPILALIYLLAPESRAGRFIRTPAVRFAMYLSSVLVFILLVIMRAEKVGYDGPDGGHLAPDGTVPEWIIFVWILALLLEEGRFMVKLGPRASLNSNGVTAWLIIIIYLAAFILRVAASVEHGGPKSILRFRWDAYDTTLIAEALTSIGCVLVILRLLPLFILDRILGPLALSMSRMVKDIIKFLVIFFVIVIAFSAALNELYYFYGQQIDSLCSTASANFTSPLVNTDCDTSNAFYRFQGAFEELFWSLFGLGSKDTLDLSINPKANSGSDLQEHTLTMYIGEALYGLYMVVAVVVLLNMLIAMMSNSYQQIADNETTEWRFEVTKLMLRYIRDDTTLPVPFNLIPTPKFIYNNVIKRFCQKNRYKSDQHCKLQAKAENNRRYKDVLSRLVRRYLLLHAREKGVEPIFADVTTDEPVVTMTTETSIKAEPDGMPVGSPEPSKRKQVGGAGEGVWAKILVGPQQEEAEGEEHSC
ncbi:PREDICTED: short transient receptor potential channel 4-like [Branchiostoma belcheri]|uniref:Short transient receptor potential channel 4-like n=1 Tax=Branchiostoma belcheri TaxID=7741 RepID=A0A6P4Y5B3_BRABE|nr:PREDICTED: short transient receptor potential channel 4-like [Branchiostoma belcheri]